MDRIIKKKKWPARKIVWVSLTGIFIILVGYNLIFGDRSSKLNVKTERISIATVRTGEFQEFIPVTGNIIPIKTIYLDAVEGGWVEKIYLEAGSVVEKGDKILKLANTDLFLNIMNREAELFQQSNNLRNTRLAMEQNSLQVKAQLLELDLNMKKQKRIYENSKELRKQNLISEIESQEAKDNYDYLVDTRELTLQSHHQDSIFRAVQIDQLEASLQRMQDNLEIVKQNMDNLVVKAPVSGHLTSLNAEIGESKTRGERFGQIDVLDGFKVRAPIDEHYISRIDVGLVGHFTFAGDTFDLVIKKVYPEVLDGRFQVDMEFVNEHPQGIRRGQTLHIRLALGDLSEAVLLDRGGFYQKTGGQWVFVVDETDQIAVKRDISIGRQNPDVYEVLSGLQPGEKVITSPYDNYGKADKLILKD